MRVGKLIDELRKHDPDLDVWIDDDGTIFRPQDFRLEAKPEEKSVHLVVSLDPLQHPVECPKCGEQFEVACD